MHRSLVGGPGGRLSVRANIAVHGYRISTGRGSRADGKLFGMRRADKFGAGDHSALLSRLFSSPATSVGASVGVKWPTSSSRRRRASGIRDAKARALAGVQYGSRAPNRTVVGAVIRGRALRVRTMAPRPRR